MNWEAVGALGEWIGGVAVLANLQDKLSTREAIKAWVALRPLADPEFVAWAEAKLDLDIPPLAPTV